jgi:hypothetical protein
MSDENLAMVRNVRSIVYILLSFVQISVNFTTTTQHTVVSRNKYVLYVVQIDISDIS